MKSRGSAVFILVAALLLVGCYGVKDSKNQKRTDNTEAAETAASPELQWTEEEINAVFLSENQAEEVIASVPASDGAYELVGVVMFRDRESDNLRLAFMDKDGCCQFCGLEAPPCSPPELRYLGDGEISFRFYDENDQPQDCFICFSRDGGQVHFKSDTPINEDGA